MTCTDTGVDGRPGAGQPSVPPEPAADTPSPLLVLVTGTGGFLAAMDVSLANGLLPSLGASFGTTSSAALAWVIAVYAIVFAGALVPAGRLADRYGRRAGFGWGLATLAAGSVVCAAAGSLPTMLLGRALQALGASAASPASLAMLVAAVRPGARQVHAARWAGAGAIGIASGPLLGAAATDLVSWRLAFVVSAAVAGLALVALPRVATSPQPRVDRALPDALSTVLFVAATASVTAGVSGIGQWGALDSRTLAVLVGAGLLSGLFVLRCRTAVDPVLDVRLLRRQVVAASTAVTLLYSVAFFGLVYSFMLFLRDRWQLPLLTAGLAMLPVPLSVLLLTLRIGGVADRRGFRAPVAAGTLVMGMGLVLTAVVAHGRTFSAAWLLALAVVGIGSGLSFPLLAAAALSGLPDADLAAASAMNQCARQVGAALGISLTVLFLGQADATAAQYHRSWFADAGLCVLAAACSGALPGRDRPSRPGPGPRLPTGQSVPL